MQTTCLVLDKRLDYFNEYIQPEFKKRFNIDVKRFLAGDGKLDGEVYDYIDDPLAQPIRYTNSTTYPTWYTPPAYNAYCSHYHIFTNFLNSNQKYLLLLEDDVLVHMDFEDIVGGDIEGFVQGLEADMLYLGSYGASKKGYYHNDGILSLPRLSGVGGFHAVVLTRKVVKRLQEIPPYSPFDEMAAKYIHGNAFKCFAITPSVITQKDGYSFVEKAYLKKPGREL